MLFNSIEFLIFFPILTAVYFLNTALIKKNFISQLILLAASLYFYACWNAAYLALILFSVCVTFASGILMEKKPDHKKLILTLSLVINLAILVFFKYFNFLASAGNSIFTLLGCGLKIPAVNVLLPVGISFYTFQALGYSIDVYRGTLKAEKNFFTYALFVTFFPQLVAGPIERSENLLPQFKADTHFNYENVTDGLKLAAWGMFKKVVISDFIALYVNGIYNNVAEATGLSLVLATVYFSIQIFCDFSGYSDIAIGVAKVLGFKLMKNFNKPYFSASIVEFWRNWHISLSFWFKDYLYIPLGGNRKGTFRRYLNLFITFFVSGIWHGANYTFILWGSIHGLYQIAELSTKKFRTSVLTRAGLIAPDGTKKAVVILWRILLTYILVCFSWIFFRANNLDDTATIMKKLLLIPDEIRGILTGYSALGIKETIRNVFLLTHEQSGHAFKQLTISWIYIAVLFAVGIITRKESGLVIIKRQNVIARWICYFALFYIIAYTFIASPNESQFIYFQF